MNARMILGMVLVAAIALAGWQTYRNGQLNEVASQYEAAIEDMRTAIIDQHNRYQQTDRMLAKSNRQYKQTELKARELEYALGNQNDACLDRIIADDIINRVLEFRAS